jgi:hypothetical protein
VPGWRKIAKIESSTALCDPIPMTAGTRGDIELLSDRHEMIDMGGAAP